jgi:hypothetical protein
VGSWRSVRFDERRGRHRTHAAVPDLRFLLSHDGGGGRRGPWNWR